MTNRSHQAAAAGPALPVRWRAPEGSPKALRWVISAALPARRAPARTNARCSGTHRAHAAGRRCAGVRVAPAVEAVLRVPRVHLEAQPVALHLARIDARRSPARASSPQRDGLGARRSGSRLPSTSTSCGRSRGRRPRAASRAASPAGCQSPSISFDAGLGDAAAQRALGADLVERTLAGLRAERLESFRPRIGASSSRITAAATTGPASGPQPPRRPRRPVPASRQRTEAPLLSEPGSSRSHRSRPAPYRGAASGCSSANRADSAAQASGSASQARPARARFSAVASPCSSSGTAVAQQDVGQADPRQHLLAPHPVPRQPVHRVGDDHRALEEGRLRVAVPLAISVTSHAASARCDWPSSSSIGAAGAAREHRLDQAAQPGTTGSTKRRLGHSRHIRSAAAIRPRRDVNDLGLQYCPAAARPRCRLRTVQRQAARRASAPGSRRLAGGRRSSGCRVP